MAEAADDERLQALFQDIARLKAEEAAACKQLAEEAAAAAAALIPLQYKDAAEEQLLTQLPVPQDIPGILSELSSIAATQTHMEHVQELQALIKQMQRELRTIERPVSRDPADLTHYFSGLSGILPAHARCLQLSEATAALPTSGIPSPLRIQADVALEHAATAQDKLVSSLGGVIRGQLALLGWPPPLAESSSLHQEGPVWQGLEGANERVMANLWQAIEALVRVQRAVQAASFQLAEDTGFDAESEEAPEVPSEGPPLWAVEQIAQPLADKLQLHFGPGRPMDQPDRPEGLLGLVIKLVRVHAPLLTPLQNAVSAPLVDLPQHAYFLPAEFARAMRGIVQAMLKEHLLPRLAEQGNEHAWLHMAECLTAFERELAPLRGIPRHTADPLDDALELWARGSCLETLCLRQEWRDGWWGAEKADALRQAEEVCDAPDAWHPSALVWSSPEDDVIHSSSHEVVQPWQTEFWPPCCADGVLLLTSHAAGKAACLHSQDFRSQYAAAVPQAVLGFFRGRLERLLKTAQDFRDLASESWAPRVAAYACAAHHLQHSLREATGVLLLLDMPREGSSRSVLAHEADQLGSFQDKVCKRLAQAVSTRFDDACSSYRRRRGLEAFAASTYDGREDRVSGTLQGAISGLQDDVQRLAELLDSVLFRQVWRYVTIGIQHSLFNGVATEARFSQQGSQQFATDCTAVINAFAPWTARPAAHFRELTDATILLSMDRATAQELEHWLSASGSDEQHLSQADSNGDAPDAHAQALLKQRGVTRLEAAHAMAVLSRRLW